MSKYQLWPKDSLFSETVDVCANRHKGNPESDAAFRANSDRLTHMENKVYEVIRQSGERGLTVDEIAEMFHSTPNCISGRCSALKFKNMVRKAGTRLTRGGNNAAVLIAT
jgi:hypothetical protein